MGSFMKTFLGQDIRIGEAAYYVFRGGEYNGYRYDGGYVGALAYPSDNVEDGSIPSYNLTSIPTKFNGLKYFLDECGVDGQFPAPQDASRPETIYCQPVYPNATEFDLYDSSQPCFQVAATYNPNYQKWMIGYKFRSYVNEQYPKGYWETNYDVYYSSIANMFPSGFVYAVYDDYDGIDGENPTTTDEEWNAIYFYTFAQFDPVDENMENIDPLTLFGIALGKHFRWGKGSGTGWMYLDMDYGSYMTESLLEYFNEPYSYKNSYRLVTDEINYAYDVEHWSTKWNGWWTYAHQGQQYYYAIMGIGAEIPDEPEPIPPDDEDDTETQTEEEKKDEGGDNDIDQSPGHKDVMATGLCQLFCPDEQELEELAKYLWSDDYATNLEKWGLKPMDQIIMFGVIPFKLPSSLKDSQEYVRLCGKETPVLMTPLKRSKYTKFTEFIKISGPTQRYPDYQGMNIQLFIPYIGFVPLKPEDIFGRYLGMKYTVDLVTGDTLVWVIVKDSANAARGRIIGHYDGNILTNLPLSATDYASYYKQMRQGSFGMIGAIAAPIGGAIAGGMKGGIPGAIAGGLIGLVSGINQGMAAEDQIRSAQPEVQRSGSLGGSLSYLSYNTPYLYMSFPRRYQNGFYKYNGIATYKEMTISDCEGFIKVMSIINDKVQCTDTEKQMINKLLSSGVYMN